MARQKRKYLTITQFQEFLGGDINRMTIYKHIWAGNIPVKKMGQKFLIPMKWIEEKYGEYDG